MKIALGAKAKLGFIDGIVDPPSQNSTLLINLSTINLRLRHRLVSCPWSLLNHISKTSCAVQDLTEWVWAI